MKNKEKCCRPVLDWLFVMIIAAILFFFGCRSAYNSPRHPGYSSTPSAYLIAEIPELELPKPYEIKSNKKPKGKKDMIKMPLHTIHRKELTKKQIRENKK